MDVLVVVDMQKDFISGALGTKEAVAIVPRVAEKIAQAKKAGKTVVFTRDTHTEDYLQTQEGRNLPGAGPCTNAWAGQNRDTGETSASAAGADGSELSIIC